LYVHCAGVILYNLLVFGKKIYSEVLRLFFYDKFLKMNFGVIFFVVQNEK